MAVKAKELSWSLSKARTFEECPRRYYLHHYLAKWGYSPDAPEDARRALEMRNIKGLDMWVGEVVHSTIQWALEQIRDGTPPAGETQACEEARRRLSEGWLASQKRLWRTQPEEGYPNLFDHYYGIPWQKATTDRLKTKAFTSLKNFFNSPVFRRIADTSPDKWLPIEKYSAFRLDGILFYLKFDFAMKDGQGIRVYDWKTGNPSPSECRQLACYAMYTSGKWEVPLSDIHVSAVHLQPEFSSDDRLVDEDDIIETKSFVRQSFDGMVKCLRNPARDIAVMADFPTTGNYLRCARCNFRGLCEQGIQATGSIEDAPVPEDWDG